MRLNKYIYLDNASTSFPKPIGIINSMSNYLKNIGANPGRSNHTLGIKSNNAIENVRKQISKILKLESPNKIFFTLNATHALNIILKGSLKNGDHVIITNFEHNSVLRPIHKLKLKRNIHYDIVSSNSDGIFNLELFEQKIKSNTKLIIVNHASNVLGVISPIIEIGKITKKNNIKFLIDASQTIGDVEVNILKNNADFIAFTGHKNLLGPSGTGGFYAKNPSDLETLYEGGTGSNSDSLYHPEELPKKFESGTLNYLGIVGLGSSISFLQKNQIKFIHSYKMKLTQYLLEQLSEIPQITIYGTKNIENKVAVVSINLKGIYPNELSFVLDKKYKIITSCGLHCAPLVHNKINTMPFGVTRISIGYKNNIRELDYLIRSLKAIAKGI